MFQEQQHSKIRTLLTFVLVLSLTAKAATQEPTHVLKHDDFVGCISISSNSKLIAAGCSTHTKETGAIVVWDLKTGTLIRKLKGHAFSLAGLEFMQDDKYLVSAGLASTVRVCKLSTGEDVSHIEKLNALTGLVSIGRSGMFGTFESKRFRVWDISDPAAPRESMDLPKVGEGGIGVFSADGKLWAEAVNSANLTELSPKLPCSIALWDVASGKLLKKFKGQKDNVLRVTFSNDKRFLALGYVFGPNNLEILDVKEGKVLFKGSHPFLPASMAFSRNGNYLAVGSAISGTLNIWDVKKMAITKTINAHSGTIQCLEFSADGRYLVSGSADHTVKIWEFEKLK